MDIDVVRNSERIYYRFEEVPEGASEVPLVSDQNFPREGSVEDPPISTPKSGFWRRQFGSSVTAKQKGFDWTFGVVMPLICFLFDPIVFRGGGGGGIMGRYQLPAYLLAFVSIIGMNAWLLWGERLQWLNGWLAGLFFVGSGISLIVGAILFPFSILGILMLMGFLGFTPLFSSIVYLRNGVRAMRTASEVRE